MRLEAFLVRTAILIGVTTLTTRVLESKANAVFITVNATQQVANDGLCSFEEAVLATTGSLGGNDCPAPDYGSYDWIYLPGIAASYMVNPGSTLSSTRPLYVTGDGQGITNIVIKNLGGSQHHGLDISASGGVFVDDLSIAGGAGNHDIGIENSSSDLDMYDVSLTGFGSTALENLNLGTAHFEYSTIGGNGFGAALASGGGARNWGVIFVTSSTISANHGYYGGGVYNLGLLIVDSSTFDGNVARFSGGGIYSGGFAGSVSARLELQNCTFANNSTTTSNSPGSTSMGGGAIFWDGGTSPGGGYFEVSFITVANNQSQGAGGGFNFQPNGNGTVEYGYGLFANNMAPVGPDISGNMQFYYSPTLVTNASGITNRPSTWIVTTTPGLGTFGSTGDDPKVFPLLSGSPAIDATHDSTPAVDQRGWSRPIDGNNDGFAYSDLGAFEYSP
jgi:predicted outer membrane repeat protein